MATIPWAAMNCSVPTGSITLPTPAIRKFAAIRMRPNRPPNFSVLDMFLATALCTRATAERELKHFDKAVAIHTEALEHFQALSAAGPDPNEKHFDADEWHDAADRGDRKRSGIETARAEDRIHQPIQR